MSKKYIQAVITIPIEITGTNVSDYKYNVVNNDIHLEYQSLDDFAKFQLKTSENKLKSDYGLEDNDLSLPALFSSSNTGSSNPPSTGPSTGSTGTGPPPSTGPSTGSTGTGPPPSTGPSTGSTGTGPPHVPVKVKDDDLKKVHDYIKARPQSNPDPSIKHFKDLDNAVDVNKGIQHYINACIAKAKDTTTTIDSILAEIYKAPAITKDEYDKIVEYIDYTIDPTDQFLTDGAPDTIWSNFSTGMSEMSNGHLYKVIYDEYMKKQEPPGTKLSKADKKRIRPDIMDASTVANTVENITKEVKALYGTPIDTIEQEQEESGSGSGSGSGITLESVALIVMAHADFNPKPDQSLVEAQIQKYINVKTDPLGTLLSTIKSAFEKKVSLTTEEGTIISTIIRSIKDNSPEGINAMVAVNNIVSIRKEIENKGFEPEDISHGIARYMDRENLTILQLNATIVTDIDTVIIQLSHYILEVKKEKITKLVFTNDPKTYSEYDIRNGLDKYLTDTSTRTQRLKEIKDIISKPSFDLKDLKDLDADIINAKAGGGKRRKNNIEPRQAKSKRKSLRKSAYRPNTFHFTRRHK
jgi:hypothetical protein